jgi:hypothetical protein
MTSIEYSIRVLEQEAGAAYIRSVLAQDWHALARPLATEFENVKGIIETFLPTTCTAAAAHDFQTGGVTRTAISQKWIVDVTQAFFHGSTDRLLLAQEPLAQRCDPVQDWQRPQIHYCGEDIYYVCTSDTLRDQLETVFRFATALPWSLAILTALPDAERGRLLNADALEENDLVTLCRNTRAIIVGGVYDAEGYLVWKREA